MQYLEYEKCDGMGQQNTVQVWSGGQAATKQVLTSGGE